MIKVSSHSTLRVAHKLLIFCKFFQNFSIFAIVFSLTWPATIWSAVEHVEVVALFENKAVLLIDEDRVLLSVGETTKHGITLISADAKGAVVEIEGKKHRYTLGGLVRSSPNEHANTEKKIYVYRGPDNLFRTTGSINGYPVNFLVDTGASSIAISSQEARRLGINYRLSGKPIWISTASGTEPGFRVVMDRVSIAGITLRSVQGLVIEGAEPSTPLLGMSYLNRFEITNDGQVMTLRQKY